MVFKRIIFQNRYVEHETPPPFMAKAILNFHFYYLTPSLRWRGGLGRFEKVLDWSWVFWGNEGTFWGNLGWFWDVLGGSWEIFSRVIEGRFGTIQVIQGHNRMFLGCSRVFWGWFGDSVRWFEVVFGCSGCSGSGLLMQQYGAIFGTMEVQCKRHKLDQSCLIRCPTPWS